MMTYCEGVLFNVASNRTFKMGHLVQSFNSFRCSCLFGFFLQEAWLHVNIRYSCYFKVSIFLTQRKMYGSDVSAVIFSVLYMYT